MYDTNHTSFNQYFFMKIECDTRVSECEWAREHTNVVSERNLFNEISLQHLWIRKYNCSWNCALVDLFSALHCIASILHERSSHLTKCGNHLNKGKLQITCDARRRKWAQETRKSIANLRNGCEKQLMISFQIRFQTKVDWGGWRWACQRFHLKMNLNCIVCMHRTAPHRRRQYKIKYCCRWPII